MSFFKTLTRPIGSPEASSTDEERAALSGNNTTTNEAPSTSSIAEIEVGSGQEGKLILIDLELIDSNPYQPRRSFDNEHLVELAASIAEFGILQPIIVQAEGNRYQLVAGERRTKAARLAGLKMIPAIVREMPADQVAMISLIENLQREDLNVIEEANGYARLLAEFTLTQEELARRLGRSQSGIANKLRLLRLPSAIQQNLAIGRLTERHARTLLRLPSAEEQLSALEEVFERGLNVRQTESLVDELLSRIDATKEIEDAPPIKRIRRFIPKNLLLFFNEFTRITRTMNDAGIATAIEQVEDEDGYTITINIAKRKPE